MEKNPFSESWFNINLSVESEGRVRDRIEALVGIAKNGVVLLSNTYNHSIEQSLELSTRRKEFTLDKNSFLKSFSIVCEIFFWKKSFFDFFWLWKKRGEIWRVYGRIRGGEEVCVLSIVVFHES